MTQKHTLTGNNLGFKEVKKNSVIRASNPGKLFSNLKFAKSEIEVLVFRKKPETNYENAIFAFHCCNKH